MSRIYLSPPDAGPADRASLLEAFDSGWLAPVGPDLDRFEREMAALVERGHAVALSSGRAALHLALLELGVGPGDDVLVSTFTFVASATAVTAVGASPVFVDSDEATWNMNPDLLAEVLAARARVHRLPAAVVLVDLYGQCADYDRILPVCERYGVPVVEDAAEALGATFAGRPAGSFGHFGVFSFNGNKIITSTGGGMLVTDDARAAEHARHLATQAREPTPYYEHRELGYNYRLSNLLAALGRSQLADLPRRVARRRAINARYRAALADLPVSFMPEAAYGTPTCWLTCLTVDRSASGLTPDDVRLALEEYDIEARRTWKPMHLQPVFAEAEARVDGTAQRLFESGLCLPSGSSLTDDQQDAVIAAVRSSFENPPERTAPPSAETPRNRAGLVP